MRLLQKFKDTVNFIENPSIPLIYYILLFISSITLRNFLEIFINDASVTFRLLPPDHYLYLNSGASLAASFLHFYFFWLFLLLSLSLIIFTITKQPILTIIKAAFSLSIIINLTPVFDLLITGGKGIKLAYALPKNILDLPSLLKILTPGICLTSITGILLVFAYCVIKTGKRTKGLLAVTALCLLLAALASLPVIINAYHPMLIIRNLLIALFFEVSAVLFLTNKKLFLAIIKDIRWARLSHYYLMLVFGILITKAPAVKTVCRNFDSFLLIMLSTFLCWLCAIMFNNIEDYGIDRITNTSRPLANNTVPKVIYEKTALWCLAGAFILALSVNFQSSFFVLLLAGNSFIYSLPPLRFKRVPLLSKIFISLNSLIAVMMGYTFAGKELLGFPEIITWYFLIFVTLSMNFIDFKDYEGDRNAGIKTLPVILGLKISKLIIGASFLITYGALSFIFLDLRILTPALIFGLIQFFLINKKVYKEKWILITHLIGITALFFYLNSPW